MNLPSLNTEMLELVITRLHAHRKYILSQMYDKKQIVKANSVFNTIIDSLTMNESIVINGDDKITKSVLDVYHEIYTTTESRFKGRTGDFYLEKL